jgi:hypothetical protein
MGTDRQDHISRTRPQHETTAKARTIRAERGIHKTLHKWNIFPRNRRSYAIIAPRVAPKKDVVKPTNKAVGIHK